MDIEIRKMETADVGAVLDLIREFAAFEDLSQYCEVDEERLATAMFGETGVVEGLVALAGRESIGYTLFFPNFSSFRGQRGFYLDDIYVKQEYRGQAVGERMLREVARMADERGFERIDFLVLDWNRPAIAFYDKLGAVPDPDERHYKFVDEAFRRLSS